MEWLFVLVTFCSVSVISKGANCPRIVCYFTNWAQYRPEAGKFTVYDSDPKQCTHAIYAFSKIKENELIADEWNDDATEWTYGMYDMFTLLKHKYPNLKLMLSVNGREKESNAFHDVAQNSANRMEFAKSVLTFLRDRRFEGLNLDWEYPAYGNSPLEDKNHYTLLIQRIPAAATQATLSDKQQGVFYMHCPTDRTAHTTAFDDPIVDPWFERKIAQTAIGSTEKDRSDTPKRESRVVFISAAGDVVTAQRATLSCQHELRKAFDAENQQDQINEKLLLSATVPAKKNLIDAGYNIPEIMKHLDFINLKTYDLRGSNDTVTGHHSPLYSSSKDVGDEKQLNIDWAVKYWVSKGAPRDKINVGFAAYGRSFTLKSTSWTSLRSPVKEEGKPGKYTQEGGVLAYYEICEMKKTGGTVHRILDQGNVPYIVKGDQWVGYDDELSFSVKAQYVKNQTFGGITIWSMDLDDFKGGCHKRVNPLLRAVKKQCGFPTSLYIPPHHLKSRSSASSLVSSALIIYITIITMVNVIKCHYHSL